MKKKQSIKSQSSGLTCSLRNLNEFFKNTNISKRIPVNPKKPHKKYKEADQSNKGDNIPKNSLTIAAEPRRVMMSLATVFDAMI